MHVLILFFEQKRAQFFSGKTIDTKILIEFKTSNSFYKLPKSVHAIR
jgi:hypothetical protein